jgi:hypothetical protein
MGMSNEKRSAKQHRTHTTLNWQNRWTQALIRKWKQRITSLRFQRYDVRTGINALYTELYKR